jgi:macrolide transport system ATP-binding/permease protein
MPPILQVRDLVKTYHVGEHTVRALRGANMDVQAGEFVAITGPSGSGKSTLMHILGCLDRPTSGQYILDGNDVSRMSKDQLAVIRNRKIGFVFQGFNLLSRTTALDNVELPLLYNGTLKLKTSERHQRAKDALASVGLGERFNHFPNQLSGGQQQRVAIARALVTQPAILLADEPTGNLDTRTSIEVMGIFQKLNKERGITILLITHEMDIAEYGTRFVRFRDGKIQTDSPVHNRRDAQKELAALPPPEEDPPVMASDEAAVDHIGGVVYELSMSILMTLRIALKALNRNKMRTMLTMLGMIIGVGAVITMVALGKGAQTTIEEQVKAAGTNMININAGNFTQGGVRGGQGTSNTLMPEDAAALREVPGVQYVAAGANTRGTVVAGNQNWSTSVEGTEVDWPLIRSWPVKYGSFFTQQDVNSAAKVAVLGSGVADTLFGPDTDPTGQVIRIRSQPFKVIGVMSSKGVGSMGNDQDDVIMVPYTTVIKKLQGQQHISKITVSASTPETAPVAAAISEVLRTRHKLMPGDPDDFMVRTLEEMAAVRSETARTMGTLLAAIAGVSLLVGGIGIMNIMLVSVTERTREIGLRMAIGARGKDVLLQFLVEAVVLSLFGGIIGIGFGFGLAAAAEKFLQWPTTIPPNAIGMAFGFAAATGVFFGFYPARKAARLDPIEALRFE